jgi:hypothetical protein
VGTIIHLGFGERIVCGRQGLGRQDHTVTRKQAFLDVDVTGTVVLRDLGTTNGSYVNGKKIDFAELQEADEIVLGASFYSLVVVPTNPDTVRVCPECGEIPRWEDAVRDEFLRCRGCRAVVSTTHPCELVIAATVMTRALERFDRARQDERLAEEIKLLERDLPPVAFEAIVLERYGTRVRVRHDAAVIPPDSPAIWPLLVDASDAKDPILAELPAGTLLTVSHGSGTYLLGELQSVPFRVPVRLVDPA